MSIKTNAKSGTLNKEVYDLFPEDLQNRLLHLARQCDSEEEFIGAVMVGACPICGSNNSRDCEDTPLQDSTVGICLKCHAMWCLNCGALCESDRTICEHWRICEECDITLCEINPNDCPKIKQKRRIKMKKLHTFTEDKEDFMCSINDGTYYITARLELIDDRSCDYGGIDLKDDDILAEINIGNEGLSGFLNRLIRCFYLETWTEELFMVAPAALR